MASGAIAYLIKEKNVFKNNNNRQQQSVVVHRIVKSSWGTICYRHNLFKTKPQQPHLFTVIWRTTKRQNYYCVGLQCRKLAT